MTETIRKHFYLSGDVQGVGFRSRAMHAAGILGITGFVKNLYDGRVELEIQGNRDDIERFLPMIESRGGIDISKIEAQDCAVKVDEYSFGIRY